MSTMGNHIGQALIETIISMGAFISLLSFGVWGFNYEYRLLLCQKTLFETTRSELNQKEGRLSEQPLLNQVHLIRTKESLIGQMNCGESHLLKLELKKLEKWASK